MANALTARGLGKQYGRRWALSDCSLEIPAGRVTGLVGPNGAGKTTLLNLAAGMLRPTAGSIEVLGGIPGSGPGQLRRVGYVAQETPVLARLSVADHLRLGAKMNCDWDAPFAASRIDRLQLDPKQKAGRLSGGQRAQLALTMAVGKRPELLILDEPVASLDPLARREFLRTLLETTAERQMSVVLSSHLVSDLERTCDYLVVLVGSRVQLAGDVDQLLAAHWLLTGAQPGANATPPGWPVIAASTSLGQTTVLVRAGGPVTDPAWTLSKPSLEDLVLGYMRRVEGEGSDRAFAEVTR
jgi:ABC-2 type transport system ATP-binding protein